MEQDETHPHSDRSANPPGSRGDGHGASSPAPRGRHDILETEDDSAFWPEVDGMLTGEFSTDMLPKLGDYRLGAIEDDDLAPPGVVAPETAAAPAPETVSADLTGDPFAFDEEQPPPPPASEAPATQPPPPASEAPATQLPPPASEAPATQLPPPASEAPATQLPPPASEAPAVPDPGVAGVESNSAAAGETIRLAAETGPLKPFSAAGFPPPEGEANGAAESNASRRGAHDIDPDQLGFNVVPDEPAFGAFVPDLNDGPFAPTADSPSSSRSLFDGPAGNGVPTVATPSTRLFDEVEGLPSVGKADGGRLFPPKEETVGQAGPILDGPPPPSGPDSSPTFGAPLIDLTSDLKYSTPTGAPPVSLERSTVVDPLQGQPAGSSFLEGAAGPQYGTAGGHDANMAAGVNLEQPGSRPPGSVRAPDEPQMQRRELLLDVVDRQWFTSALVAAVAVIVGVFGWVVYLRSGNSDEQVVAASTTTADLSSTSSEAAAGAAAARSEQPASSATTTTVAETSTTVTTAAPRPTSRPATTPTTEASTTEPTTSSTEPTTSSTEPTTSSTEPTTSSTEPTTSSTEPTTSSTEPTTSSTEPTTSSTEPTTSSTEPTTSSTEPTTSSTEPTTSSTEATDSTTGSSTDDGGTGSTP